MNKDLLLKGAFGPDGFRDELYLTFKKTEGCVEIQVLILPESKTKHANKQKEMVLMSFKPA
jgi:hypothetical protein